MARCNDCNKFVGVNQAESQLTDLEVDQDGCVTGSCTLALECSDCGSELKTSDVEVNEQVEGAEEHMSAHDKKNPSHSYELSITDSEVGDADKFEGKGRGMKHFYGIEGQFTVECSCKKFKADGKFSEFVQASHFDDC